MERNLSFFLLFPVEHWQQYRVLHQNMFSSLSQGVLQSRNIREFGLTNVDFLNSIPFFDKVYDFLSLEISLYFPATLCVSLLFIFICWHGTDSSLIALGFVTLFSSLLYRNIYCCLFFPNLQHKNKQTKQYRHHRNYSKNWL